MLAHARHLTRFLHTRLAIYSHIADVVAADFNATCQADVRSAFTTLFNLAINGSFARVQAELNLCAAPADKIEVGCCC